MDKRAIEALLMHLAAAADVLGHALVNDRTAEPSRIAEAVEAAGEDAATYLRRDPSLHGSVDGLTAPGSSFRAVAANRLAHRLWRAAQSGADGAEALRAAALTLAFQARRDTGVDIHPGARLGPAFVVDHGYGTVIGETVETGARCYVLNGVTLGARGIADNPTGRRHPKLGDDVEIGSFVCVLGPVTIGDGVFIGPHCTVCADVPPRARLRLRREVQVELHDGIAEGTRRARAGREGSATAKRQPLALVLEGGGR